MSNETYEQLKLSNQLCFPLYACAKEIVRKYKPFLDPLDLTYTQYITMMVMWEKKEVTVNELGKYLYLDSGTMTPLLKKLESKGYIIRERKQADERVVTISITEKGEKLKEEARDIPMKLGECIPLKAAEAKDLFVLLQKLLKSVEDI